MMNKRRSSTIPYGYKLKEDKVLEPVEKEIKKKKKKKKKTQKKGLLSKDGTTI